ncbi:MAG: alpha/beta hydrolase [Mycoplasmoidaceae bacterium]|nr:alpha/beta hydrolase [Mycoplasmoidaceae bacterium]
MKKTKTKKQTKNLIYIHGFSASKNDHPELKKHVEACGYNFYSFDLPAHGTNKKNFKIEDVDLNFLVDFCVTKIKSFNLSEFIIMGHSMGGSITTIIAGEQYFKKELKAIVLEAPHNKRVVMRSLYSTKKAIQTIKEILTKQNKTPTLATYLKEMKSEKNDYLPLLFNILNLPALNRIQAALESISVPTLLLLGNKDIYIPLRDTRENYSDHLDDLEIHVIKGAGHCISIDQPKEFYKYFDAYLERISKNE